MDKALVMKLTSETGHVARQYDCSLVLCDAREATMGMSTVEIYELPKIFVAILLETGVQIYKFKRALVMSADVDDFTFFETVSRNRGQNVMLFRSMDAAREWLIGK
jgi:hypothetical protein